MINVKWSTLAQTGDVFRRQPSTDRCNHKTHIQEENSSPSHRMRVHFVTLFPKPNRAKWSTSCYCWTSPKDSPKSLIKILLQRFLDETIRVPNSEIKQLSFKISKVMKTGRRKVWGGFQPQSGPLPPNVVFSSLHHTAAERKKTPACLRLLSWRDESLLPHHR
jgi:hypothetical protein